MIHWSHSPTCLPTAADGAKHITESNLPFPRTKGKQPILHGPHQPNPAVANRRARQEVALLPSVTIMQHYQNKSRIIQQQRSTFSQHPDQCVSLLLLSLVFPVVVIRNDLSVHEGRIGLPCCRPRAKSFPMREVLTLTVTTRSSEMWSTM